jgi:hypothetical protein
MGLTPEEAGRIADQIHAVIDECIKMLSRAGEHKSVVEMVILDLLRAYKDILVLYMCIKE